MPLTLHIPTGAQTQFLEITHLVEQELTRLGLRDGVLHLFTVHTTCGLTINENADPDVLHDLEQRLADMIPHHHPQDRHGEGNSAAHLRSSLFGPDLTIPVSQGKLVLGTWQGIYLCEFDGPRTRKLIFTALAT